MTPLTESQKLPSWWALLKALSYPGGPSSTRFVYLAVFAVLSLAYLIVVLSFAWVYVHDPRHPADAGILAVLTLMSGSLGAIVANAHIKRSAQAREVANGQP